MCTVITTPPLMHMRIDAMKVGTWHNYWLVKLRTLNPRRYSVDYYVEPSLIILDANSFDQQDLPSIETLRPLSRVCNMKNQPPSFGKLTFVPCRTPWYLNKRTLKVQILQLVWQKCSQGQRLS